MLRTTKIIICLVVFFPAVSVHASSILYGASSNLSIIDPSTAEATVVGSLGGGIHMSGLKWDWSTNTLYGVDASGNNLYTVNTSTGAETLVGGYDLGVPGAGLTGLAYNSAVDTLYGFSGVGSGGTLQLYELNRATGAATLVPNFPTSVNLGNLTFDSSTNKLLGIVNFSSDPLNPNFGLVEYDPFDELNPIQAIGFLGNPNNFERIDGLAYDPFTDQLFADARINSSVQQLLTIDRTTGAATIVGDLDSGGIASPDFRSLAFVPAAAVVPVPAALWLFGSALGLLGWMRRKKA